MLISRVARMYYELGLTHQEIASTLGVSRIRITRLLAEARAQGIVEITVHSDEPLFTDEERALVERFGLQHAWLSPSVGDEEKDRRSFAFVGAEAIESALDQAAGVALALSSAVALAVGAVRKRSHPNVEFVPLGGSLAGPARDSNPHELALRLASQTGGRAFHVPAPLMAASAEAARLALDDPSIAEALAHAARADVLVAGVGGMSSGEGLLLPSLSEQEHAELVRRGAVGDLAARYFDASGEPVVGAVDERVIGLDLRALRAIPHRLLIARGRAKVASLRVALATGLGSAVVTDLDTARALLDG